MSTTYPDLTGYIFACNGYWKITGEVYSVYRSNHRFRSYPVIKCTKHGKEFSWGGGFSADTLLKLYNDGVMVKCGLTEDVKVSTDGKASGARKRRISHLQSKINSMLVELNKLLLQENVGKQYPQILWRRMMNERIKELFGMAADKEFPTGVISIHPNELERFAELIIRECVEVIRNQSENSGDYWEDGLIIADNAVRKHFGVV